MSDFADGRQSGVYPGQDWRDPHGEVWHVDAIAWDGTERTAYLSSGRDTLRLPAALLARTYTRRAKKAVTEVLRVGGAS